MLRVNVSIRIWVGTLVCTICVYSNEQIKTSSQRSPLSRDWDVMKIHMICSKTICDISEN